MFPESYAQSQIVKKYPNVYGMFVEAEYIFNSKKISVFKGHIYTGQFLRSEFYRLKLMRCSELGAQRCSSVGTTGARSQHGMAGPGSHGSWGGCVAKELRQPRTYLGAVENNKNPDNEVTKIQNIGDFKIQINKILKKEPIWLHSML